MKTNHSIMLASSVWLLCNIMHPLDTCSQQLMASSKNSLNQIQKEMHTEDFTTTILVDQTPKEVFDAILNVRGWWSEEIEGSTDELNAEFDYHYEDVHRSKMKIVELIPNKKVVWLVLDNYFKFTKDETEWKGTKITFEIAEKDGKTALCFTHVGLVPEYECYEVCREGWSTYIHNSLHSLITTGKGRPNAIGKPRTESEKKLTAGK
jgi:uncharacterized protein YndB with AHSA1/START domain